MSHQGTGTSVVFATTGFQTGITITSIVPSGMSRGSVETTHLGTTVARTFEPEDLYDGGEWSITFDWLPVEVNVTGGFLLICAAESATITFPVTGADTMAATVFCTGIDVSPCEVNQRMTATARFKVSGAVTIAT